MRLKLLTLALCTQASCSGAPLDEPASGVDPLVPRMVDGRFHNPPGGTSVENSWRDQMSRWWRMATAKRNEVSPPVPEGHVLPESEAIALLVSSARWLEEELLRLRGAKPAGGGT